MTLERRDESHPPTLVKSGENLKRDGARICSGFFPTSLCGVLVFDSVSRAPPPPPPPTHTQHTHTHHTHKPLCHHECGVQAPGVG